MNKLNKPEKEDQDQENKDQLINKSDEDKDSES